MTHRKRALVIEHDPTIHLGNLADVLSAHHYDVTTLSAVSDAFPPSDDDIDLVVVLGNDHGAYDDRDYIKREKAWLTEWVSRQRPTLGICFGAQILADALGGRTHPGDHTVIGFRAISPTEAGLASPVRHFLEIPALQWHGDTFELPDVATRLAGSDDYANEAYRVDDWLLAVQFHPEATAQMYDRWLVDGGRAVESEGLDPVALRAEAERFAPAMQEASQRMVSEWLTVAEKNP